MATFRELLNAARTQIEEIDTETAEALIGQGHRVLDIREPDEFAQGSLPDSIMIARGNLESQIEAQVPDKATPIVVVCATGVRSVFGAQTLNQLGYGNVSSLAGGVDKWKSEGRNWGTRLTLTSAQRSRYSRHLLLPEIGEEGQLRLLGAKILLLGAGGLGSPAALYLAAAGVGTIGLVDMDVVDESNLQRQIIHTVDRLGQDKVQSARQALVGLNPGIDVRTHNTRLGADNVLDIIADYDVVVDGADNFPSRYVLNDASVKLGIPVVHGSIFRFEGQVTVFDPQDGPTYRDLLPKPPPPELAPSCAEAGVLGVLPGVIGSIQALEAIKLVLGLGDSLKGRLLVFDALELSFREYQLKVDPQNLVTYANRDSIEIVELDGLCQPTLSIQTMAEEV